VARGGAGHQPTPGTQLSGQPQAMREWGSAGLGGGWLAWLWEWLALHQEDPEASSEHSPQLRTPPLPNLPPCHPLSTPLAQMLTLGNQTLVNRASQHGDAVFAHLIAEVLAGNADGTRAGGAQNIQIQVVPLLSSRGGGGTGDGHTSKARTPVLVAFSAGVKPQGSAKRSNFPRTGPRHGLPTHQER